MALRLAKFCAAKWRLSTRCISTIVNEESIEKSVFISQSNDVFTNLALEDWMYKKMDFTKHHVMLLWRNDPCVVIGRHQNPWLEANIPLLEKKDISLARRNSGGGTVFHDRGNLNVTFFMPKQRYNRPNNLQILARALHREWNLKAEINKREDMVIDSTFKISGTASKLGRPNAYHHCTLLVDVNKLELSEALSRDTGEVEIVTNATKSVRSETVNLSQLVSGLSFERLVTALGWEYLRTTPVSNEDAGWDHVANQRGFQLVNPTDEWFPGLAKIREEFDSWDWKYGKTPKFVVRKKLELAGQALELSVEVERGRIDTVFLKLPHGYTWHHTNSDTVKVLSPLRGEEYREDKLSMLEERLHQEAPAFSAARSQVAASV